MDGLRASCVCQMEMKPGLTVTFGPQPMSCLSQLPHHLPSLFHAFRKQSLSWFTVNTTQERNQSLLTPDCSLPGTWLQFYICHLWSSSWQPLLGWIQVLNESKKRSSQGHTCKEQQNEDENQVNLAPTSACSTYTQQSFPSFWC